MSRACFLKNDARARRAKLDKMVPTCTSLAKYFFFASSGLPQNFYPVQKREMGGVKHNRLPFLPHTPANLWRPFLTVNSHAHTAKSRKTTVYNE